MGGDGEYDVHDYLLGQGYRVLEMNYRRYTGEIDVIAEKDGVIAFIEVKRRTSARYGRPAEAVTPSKQRRIVRTALLFLQEKHLTESPVRFDVIELLPGQLNHIEAAFDASGMGAF
jgi:putative endonuclease